MSTRMAYAYVVLDIVFEFDQWFIPRICHAIGFLVNVTSCVYDC